LWFEVVGGGEMEEKDDGAWREKKWFKLRQDTMPDAERADQYQIRYR
jgi:hypothetical protein